MVEREACASCNMIVLATSARCRATSGLLRQRVFGERLKQGGRHCLHPCRTGAAVDLGRQPDPLLEVEAIMIGSWSSRRWRTTPVKRWMKCTTDLKGIAEEDCTPEARIESPADRAAGPHAAADQILHNNNTAKSLEQDGRKCARSRWHGQPRFNQPEFLPQGLARTR